MFLDPATQPAVLPGRIVSLVPSISELLFSLGLGEHVQGITKFCVHPNEWFRSKTRVGGTKKVDLEKVRSLLPDLIIANKEENIKEEIESLASDLDVLLTDVSTVTGALEMIRMIGMHTGKAAKATELVETIQRSFGSLPSFSPVKAAYLIWRAPYMVAGGDTFINSMLSAAGLVNVFEEESRYPAVSVFDIGQKAPDVLLLSSEPYPFKEKHIAELEKRLPNTKTVLVDGEIFSWYGSRMLHAAPYFAHLRERLNQDGS